MTTRPDDLLEVIGPKTAECNGLGLVPPLMGLRPIRVSCARDAKRLMARIILALQKQTIASQTARDLCYLLVTYVTMLRETELEERVAKLERGVTHELAEAA